MFSFSSARNIYWNTNDQLENNMNEQRRQIFLHKTSPTFAKKFFDMFPNEQQIPYDDELLSPMARRAKAIIKGDPREFMG